MRVNLEGELHPETLRVLEALPLEERSRRGQFFTPRWLREEVLKHIPRLVGPRVLDPACGTGEFLLSARGYFVEPELYCWEVDPRLAEIARRVVTEARVEVVDSLTKPFREEFDVVVTNPPYYEFKPSEWVREKFREVIWGRVNVYALFVYLSLRLLKPGGWLGLVVSSSMNNGAYFKKLREYIVRVADIAYMRVVDDPYVFEEVNHTFQVLVLRKAPNTGRYVFRRGNTLIFSEKAEELKKVFEGSATLGGLGYRVQTGRVVWNQHKDKLTDDPRQGVLLIWSHNIRSGRLVLGSGRRPQYIRWGGPVDRGPAIVVKRVTGHPKRLRLEAALVPPGVVFVAENHVNVVYPPSQARLEELERLVEYLNSGLVNRLVSAITGNTQVSKNELENLVPIPLRLVGRD
ncbi:Modification methylase [Thermogladius calderae 1633]|uniref:Modification methylase n=1 Tax=Thermogladius calderae (strain DSM 22663 / VKM B-2946 / 1633) TaxID=1184251 RepID=I3TCL5_THEC1|nr:N-6 DNA methylase [Thermogladius calderae]AFK50503.1 Modification methylase [Thermogladius calderae 1633]